MPIEDGHLVAAFVQGIGSCRAGNAGADNGSLIHVFLQAPVTHESSIRRSLTGVDAPSVTVPESLIRMSRSSGGYPLRWTPQRMSLSRSSRRHGPCA